MWRIGTDGSISEAWRYAFTDRIWAPPVVADFSPTRDGLEVVVASRSQLIALDANGGTLVHFPKTWQDELRSVAAGDIDGDGNLEAVAVTNGAHSRPGAAGSEYNVSGSGVRISPIRVPPGRDSAVCPSSAPRPSIDHIR